ncbi:MAG: hypothetical protein ABSB82_12595 [Terriglobia bacterium]|jgi:hypothetical protein
MMNEFPPTSKNYPLQQIKDKELGWISSLISAVLLFSTFAYGQTAASSSTAPSTCPIQFDRFNPSSLSVRIRNTSGKKIVGLVFNAALADATEHWKWYHWDFDDTRPVRSFDWNKTIKEGERKKLSWSWTDLDFQHGGGGAFVLTSSLFDDGSIWESSGGRTSCMCLWYNSHKKGLIRPVELPSPQ